MLTAFVVIGLVVIFPRLGDAGPKDDATGTVSKTEPATKQDGTPRASLRGCQPMPDQHRPDHLAKWAFGP